GRRGEGGGGEEKVWAGGGPRGPGGARRGVARWADPHGTVGRPDARRASPPPVGDVLRCLRRDAAAPPGFHTAAGVELLRPSGVGRTSSTWSSPTIPRTSRTRGPGETSTRCRPSDSTWL